MYKNHATVFTLGWTFPYKMLQDDMKYQPRATSVLGHVSRTNPRRFPVHRAADMPDSRVELLSALLPKSTARKKRETKFGAVHINEFMSTN